MHVRAPMWLMSHPDGTTKLRGALVCMLSGAGCVWMCVLGGVRGAPLTHGRAKALIAFPWDDAMNADWMATKRTCSAAPARAEAQRVWACVCGARAARRGRPAVRDV
jgi:hypothetical protein